MISEAYRAEQARLHKTVPSYGSASVALAPQVSAIINQLEVSDVLDYGCGKGRLAPALEVDHEIRVHHYDPAIEWWADTPAPTEFVVCLDVLEHIEPDHLDDVLDDLKRVTIEAGFFSIHTGPAVKVLSDGRNAHLTQEGFRWWMPRLWDRFHIHSMVHTDTGFNVLVFPGG